MKTFAALTLALLLGTAASSATAQDVHTDANADGVGTPNDGVAARIQSTSPQAGDKGRAADEAHAGTALRSAGKSRAGKDAPAATGAGEATSKSHARAKATPRPDEDAKTQADDDTTADAAAPSAWPGENVDSSEIT
jgi:hypothetical protein